MTMTMTAMAKPTKPEMKNAPPSRKSISVVALLVAFFGVSVLVEPVDAEVSGGGAEAAKTSTCIVTGDNSAAFGAPRRSSADSQEVASDGSVYEKYFEKCPLWPSTGQPLEHRDDACDRARQNSAWAADYSNAQALAPEARAPDTVYLNMAEEKTWVCPPGATEESPSPVSVSVSGSGLVGKRFGENIGGGGGALGHPTRWILYNEATTPILIAHINALGIEISASDFATYPAHANTAVWPRGPIVLPGQIAVVEGRQGQTFVAREYKEVLPMDAVLNDDDGHSWRSFKSILPPTLAHMPQSSRFEAKHGWHVMGHPGRVLMKHRMGNIYIRNQFGAVCPKIMGANFNLTKDDVDDGRRGNPTDMNPDCNVLRKSFINKVGCPIDVYFAPQSKVEGYNCERFTSHLGPLDTFLSTDQNKRDIDAYHSPFKFENTYNGHSFVARMSHDGALVARIGLDHDIVRDCPEPRKTSDGVEVHANLGPPIVQGMPVDAMSSNTTSMRASPGEWSALVNKANSTAGHRLPPLRGKKGVGRDLLFGNATASTLVSVASISS